jgi:hypothetical protein
MAEYGDRLVCVRYPHDGVSAYVYTLTDKLDQFMKRKGVGETSS